jgi:hypothetical protein
VAEGEDGRKERRYCVREVEDTLMLTGTTEEVQEVVFSYANDDGAFADSVLLEKQRIEKEEQ